MTKLSINKQKMQMKQSFLLVAILLAFNSLFAGPVDVNMAMDFGHKFVKANFMQKEGNVLDLVYTMIYGLLLPNQ